MIRRSKALVFSAAMLAFSPAIASADGLYLKLAVDKDAGSAVKVRLTAHATRSLDLGAVPVFLVDQGQGQEPQPDLSVMPADGGKPLLLKPGQSEKRSFELTLPPGRHRIKARYRLSDRVIDSNTITVTVPSAAAASGR